MTRDMYREAIRRFRFRAQLPGESETAYRAALVAFVEVRDWGAAFELRLGKRQADWSQAEIEAFRARLEALPRSAHDPADKFMAFPVSIDTTSRPATDDALLDLARETVAFCQRFRNKSPTQEFAPMASVLTTDGRWITALPGRDDRIRALKLLAQQYPVYGFLCTADVFIHGITNHPVTHAATATKEDAFVVHIGSRTLRRVLTHVYTVTAAGVEWGRTMEVTPLQMQEDPYADVLVSVPLPTGKPS